MYNKEKPRRAFSFDFNANTEKTNGSLPKRAFSKAKKFTNLQPDTTENNMSNKDKKGNNPKPQNENSSAKKKLGNNNNAENRQSDKHNYKKNEPHWKNKTKSNFNHFEAKQQNKKGKQTNQTNKYATKGKTKFISEDLFSNDFSFSDDDLSEKKDFLKRRKEYKKVKSIENVRNENPIDIQKKNSHLKANKSKSELVRLNKFIADAGICSRREADVLIEKGEITVNQEVVTELGKKIHPKKDVVMYKGKVLKPEKFVYVLLNKPKDYITTTHDEAGRKTVMDLVKNACQERIYPVGRLDRNTTGLLLFTNDGELAKKLTHPSFEVKKVYQVALNKPITEADFTKLVEGVELEDGLVKLDDVAIITPDRTVLGIELHSGRNRVVRRLFEHLGYEVEMLDRTMFAGLTKKKLPRGKWRMLTPQEVIRLKYLI
ncbi:MAG: rRNA pseudouridine synthase [Microscillaceae bacterium]|nr:rRNA pseudouridine synthase [Microscillaceae bacterium]MDW8461512.1 pseudouridine synthase [Cytophagales bacterium]